MLGVKPSKLPRQLWSSAHCSKSCSSKDDFFYMQVLHHWNDFIIQNLSSSSWDDKTNSLVGSVSSIGLCAIKTDWDVYHNVLFPCTDPFFYHCQLPCFLLVFLQFSLDNFRMSLKQGILMTVLVIFALGKSHIQYFTKLGNIFSANSHFTGSINHSVIYIFSLYSSGGIIWGIMVTSGQKFRQTTIITNSI